MLPLRQQSVARRPSVDMNILGTLRAASTPVHLVGQLIRLRVDRLLGKALLQAYCPNFSVELVPSIQLNLAIAYIHFISDMQATNTRILHLPTPSCL